MFRSFLVTLLACTVASADSVRVSDVPAFRQALSKAKPGTTILLEPGDYAGGMMFEGVTGAPGKPIVIRAADPKNRPVIRGGNSGIQFVDAAHLEIRDLVVTGCAGNGINMDDGGTFDTPSHHILLSGLEITDIGGAGNLDALKLSGLEDFRVEKCTFARWGAKGSAVDMVGCRNGVIEDCSFTHPEGVNGVQMKGATAKVTVRRCHFHDAGSRAVNIGGSTGLQFFRPALGDPPTAEARDIVVEGNTFRGSDCPVAFVGVDRAVVRFNTIYRPRRWAMRILQETTAEGFVPCRKGSFSHNIVVFRSDEWREGGVNIGPGTEPASFAFEKNVWYCLDAPAQSKPKLPVAETGATHGKDPLLTDPEAGDLTLKKESPVKDAGIEKLP